MGHHNAVEDELAVRNLIAALGRATDLGTMDEYLAFFTEDVRVEITGLPARSGIDALKAGTGANRDTGQVGPGSDTMHFLGPPQVEIDGDTAAAHMAWALFRDASRTPALAIVGRYDDRYVRGDDGWRVERRTITLG